MNKRIFAFIMAVMMMISCMSFAEEIPTEDSYIPVEETQQAEEAPVVAEPVTEEVPEELPVEPAEEEIPSEPVEEPAEEVIPAEPVEEIAEEEIPAGPAEEEVPAESAEAVAEEESPVEPAEEVAVEEVPGEPVEEVAEEEISGEPAEEEIPVEEATEEAAEEAASHFGSGYVQLKNGTKIYKAVGGGEAYGVLADAGNVYAENVVESEDPADDWIELVFAFDGGICRGYVKFARVRVLDDSEAQQAVNAARGLSSTLWDGNIAVMALHFAVPEAETPEVTAVEDAATVEENEAVSENGENEAEPEEIAAEIVETLKKGTEEITTETAAEEEPEEIIPETVGETEVPAETMGETDGETETAAAEIVVCIPNSLSTAAADELVITAQPVNYEGLIGDTATFTVEATGTGLTYQWYYRTKGKTSWARSGASGSKTATMTVGMTSDRMKYEYSCVVKDAIGTSLRTDAVCMVKAAEPAVIKTQPINYEGRIGDTATFTVEAAGTGLTYQWYYRTKGKTSWEKSGADGNKTATMSIEMTSTRMKYEYSCVIKDVVGTSLRTDAVCMVKAPDPAVITAQPVNYEGLNGDTATFTVEAAGTGLTYQWYYRTKGKTSWEKSGADGNKTATMSIEMTSTRMKYEYSCVVKDAIGTSLRTDAVCMVKAADPAVITAQPVNFEGLIGDTATFTVEATGTGLTYQWYYRTKGKTSWAKTGASGNTTATMTIGMTSDRMKYEYSCVVKDAVGTSLRTDAVCMVKAAEPAVITVQPVNYEGQIGDTATFTVEAAGTGLTYQWYYRTKGNTSWAKSGASGSTTATMTIGMTSTRMKYEYSCVVKDAIGTSLRTDAVCMIKKIPLVITEEPQDAVITGGDAVFTVAATGNEPAYLWQTKMPGDEDWSATACTADTFTVAAADCVNGMEVRCVVTDGYGDSITSAAVTMTVLAAEITECVVSAENEVQLTVDCSAAGVEFRVIEVLDAEEILVTTSSETVITLQNVALGEHTYYVSVYYEGEDMIDTEPVSILCDKAKVNDVLYTLGEDQKLTVTGYTGTASSLVIPETVDGFTVTAVGASAFEGNTALHEIDLPDTITAIGSRAFKNCSNLSSMH